MDDFKIQLQKVIDEMCVLSQIWDDLNEVEFTKVSEIYPLKSNFNTVVMDMIKFKENLSYLVRV